MKPKMKDFLKAMGRMQDEDFVTAEEFYKMFNAVIEAVKQSAVNNKGKIEEVSKVADKKAKELETLFAELLDAVDARMKKVKDGERGNDGETPTPGIDYPDYQEIRDFIKDEVAGLPTPDDPTAIINVDYIKQSLESLEGNDRLSMDAINGIETFIDEKVRLMEANLRRGPMAITGGGTGSSSGGGSGVSTFLALTDTPSSFTANQFVKVNAAGDALEYTALAGGGDMTAAVYDPTNVAGDAFDMANMVEAANAKILTAAERTILSNTSGTNTGDQDLSTYQLKPAEGAFVDGDKSKLDGIETGADVTDATNVAAAGALMASDVDSDITTFSLPASTTISAFGATLVDDANAATARATLDVDQAGTDNSTDVTLAGTGTYLSLTGQQITVDPITESDIADLGSYITDVVSDTTPQLGGDLDAQDNNIEGAGRISFTQEYDNGTKTTNLIIDFKDDQHQKVTLTANTMILQLDTTNVGVGVYTLKIINGGLATLTWDSESGSIKWPGGTAPTLTSSGEDIVSFRWDGTNWYAVASLDFS